MTLSILPQIIIGLSVLIVWIIRYPNVESDFKSFNLNDIIRNLVGAIKITSSVLLILGSFYTEFILPSSIVLLLMMVSAQYFHHKVNNPIQKRLPSLTLLILLIFVILNNL